MAIQYVASVRHVDVGGGATPAVVLSKRTLLAADGEIAPAVAGKQILVLATTVFHRSGTAILAFRSNSAVGAIMMGQFPNTPTVQTYDFNPRGWGTASVAGESLFGDLIGAGAWHIHVTYALI